MTNPTIVRAFAAAGAVLFAAAPAAAQRPTLPVELFVGRQEFSSELRVLDQDIAGIRLGMDLADYAGIRGYYWRALNEDRDGPAPLQSYGVEAQLNLNSGRGITPFLVAGVGRVDFMDSFEDIDGNQPDDRDAAILGGGARLDLGRVGLMAAARGYLFQAPDSLSDDLRSNLQLTAGLSFRLGSSGRRAAGVSPTVLRETPDTVYVSREGTVERREDDPRQFVTIPIPREGEIYLRYGPADSAGAAGRPSIGAGAVTAGQLEAVRRQVLADLEPLLRNLMAAERSEMREMVRDELRRIGSAGLTPEVEQRLLENLEARVALRVQDRVGRVDSAGRPARPGFEPRLREWRVYTGGNVDRPRQFLLGGRLDLGPLDPRNPQLRVVPELAVGGGQAGMSVLLAGNLQYDFIPLQVRGVPLQPYGYGGLGLLVLSDPNPGRAKREAVLNLGYGVNFPVPGRDGGPRLFLEHQAIDLFDLNRLILGIRFQ
ncbi:hypothetical protein [Longimicrobium sp.]|uniref:hypothetical protein n=1 Tax=Longimicrobium sp. TaxID=2029185 RepID=UPI003B3A0448